MKTMKGYHVLYLKCDKLLLADVSEKIWNNTLNNFGISPSHYLSASALSLDAMFDMPKVEVELIPDPDM